MMIIRAKDYHLSNPPPSSLIYASLVSHTSFSFSIYASVVSHTYPHLSIHPNLIHIPGVEESKMEQNMMIPSTEAAAAVEGRFSSLPYIKGGGEDKAMRSSTTTSTTNIQ